MENKDNKQIVNFLENSSIANIYNGYASEKLATISKEDFISQLIELQNSMDIKKVSRPIEYDKGFTYVVNMKADMTYYVNISKSDTKYFDDMYNMYIQDRVKGMKINKFKKRGKIVVASILVASSLGTYGVMVHNHDKKLMEIGKEQTKIIHEYNNNISMEDAYKMAIERLSNEENHKSK